MTTFPESALLNLPLELFHTIAGFLDVPEILSLQKTCKPIHHLTYDRQLWLVLLWYQYATLPLSPSPECAFSLPTSDMERLVMRTDSINHSWLLPRQTPRRLLPRSGEWILSLELFKEKWLLSVYCDGLVYVWDIDGDDGRGGRGVKIFSLDLGSKGWTSCTSCLDSEGTHIIVAVTRAQSWTSETRIYSIALAQASIFDPPATSLATLRLPSAQIVCAIDPTLKLIAFSRIGFIDLCYWTEGNTMRSISTDNPDTDNLVSNRCAMTELFRHYINDLSGKWNGIIALRFLSPSPYLLCIKVHSLEAYPLLPPTFQNTRVSWDSSTNILPILRVPFHRNTFRQMSLSASMTLHMFPSPEPHPVNNLALGILAYDALEGLFQYTIRVRLSPVPELFVDLVGRYSLTQAQPNASSSQPASTQSNLPIPNALRASHTTQPHTRGFISTLLLGPQGKRGVWIERARNSMQRFVVAFASSSAPSSLPTGSDKINGKSVYETNSYNLQDDLIYCAFSEVSGRIILGTRSGDVLVI